MEDSQAWGWTTGPQARLWMLGASANNKHADHNLKLTALCHQLRRASLPRGKGQLIRQQACPGLLTLSDLILSKLNSDLKGTFCPGVRP